MVYYKGKDWEKALIRRRREVNMINILVCDDDKEIVDAIEIYLSQDGYQIFKAYDGEQAIEMLGIK